MPRGDVIEVPEPPGASPLKSGNCQLKQESLAGDPSMRLSGDGNRKSLAQATATAAAAAALAMAVGGGGTAPETGELAAMRAETERLQEVLADLLAKEAKAGHLPLDSAAGGVQAVVDKSLVEQPSQSGCMCRAQLKRTESPPSPSPQPLPEVLDKLPGNAADASLQACESMWDADVRGGSLYSSTLLSTARAHAENKKLEKDLRKLREVVDAQRGEASWLIQGLQRHASSSSRGSRLQCADREPGRAIDAPPLAVMEGISNRSSAPPSHFDMVHQDCSGDCHAAGLGGIVREERAASPPSRRWQARADGPEDKDREDEREVKERENIGLQRRSSGKMIGRSTGLSQSLSALPTAGSHRSSFAADIDFEETFDTSWITGGGCQGKVRSTTTVPARSVAAPPVATKAWHTVAFDDRPVQHQPNDASSCHGLTPSVDAAVAACVENRRLKRELQGLRALAHWQQGEVGMMATSGSDGEDVRGAEMRSEFR